MTKMRALSLLITLALTTSLAQAKHHHGDTPGQQPTALANATVLLIRHAEKPTDGPDLSELGQQRAQAYVSYFSEADARRTASAPGCHLRHQRVEVQQSALRDGATAVQTRADDVVGADDPTRQRRLESAVLLKRAYAVDVLVCPRCAGPMRLIAVIENEIVARKILLHLGLPARAPPRGRPWRAAGQAQLALDDPDRYDGIDDLV